jgi:rhamnosyltransferase
MSKIAAVVVLYNPNDQVIANIKAIINQVSKLFLIDNSDKINIPLIEECKSMNGIDYECVESNIGIAAALNIGAKKAITGGFQYLLTMDQDSQASPEMVKKLLQTIESSPEIGIVTAEHVNPDFQKEPDEKNVKEILYTITSGNLVNLSAFQKVGGFLEELFIDHVDHEYCLRLNQNGYKILKNSFAVVYHKVGDTKRRKFLIFYFYTTNHSGIRLYYRTRNRLYVNNLYRKKFPNYIDEERKNMVKEYLGILLFENNLWNKIKMIYLGYLHFRKGILGKLRC